MFIDGPLHASKQSSWSTEIKPGINKGVFKKLILNVLI